ncbi:MAG: hypothetical protein KGY45_03125 [Hadesarchaea archaeon]|nr:hypothetical protein [Hadesarchaea archaeon]
MAREKTPSVDMPRLFNVFDMPEIKSVRATTSIRTNFDLKDIVSKSNHIKKVRTAGKEVAKFRVNKGEYLLLFPTGYVQIHAPSEGRIKEVLKAFRNELYECGILK